MAKRPGSSLTQVEVALAAAALSQGAGRTVEEVVEDIGYGPSQLWANVLVNGSSLADGSEALMISALTGAVAAEWGLTPTMRGALSAVVYLGTLVGTLLSGWLGDAYGRRPSIILCFPVIILFSLLSSCSYGPWQLLAFRFLVGLGFGVGQPNSVAILVEVSPVRWRTVNQGLAQVAFALGELFCCLVFFLDDASMRQLDWRRLLAAGAIPAALFWCLSWLFLQESPAYLALRDPKAAREVLASMGRMNGCGHAALEIAPLPAAPASSWPAQLFGAFDSRHRWTTGALCTVCFSYNLTIYGAFFALPQLLPNMIVGISPVAALALGALIEIPFDFVGVVVGMHVSRKRALGLSFVGVAASLILFAQGSDAAGSETFMLHVGFLGLKGFPQISSLVLYVFAAESFPVSVRASGTAAVLGVGRAGAVISPLAYEWLARGTGGPGTFFRCAAALTMASLLALVTLAETYRGGPEDGGEAKGGLDELAPLLRGGPGPGA